MADPVMDARRAARESGTTWVMSGGGGGGAPVRPVQAASASGDPVAQADDPLAAALRPTRLDAVRVTEAPNPTFTVGAGRLIGCVQQVRFNSSAPGGVTGVVKDDVLSETGRVRLIDKGSTLIGTAAHGLQTGLNRVFVLWQRVRTPVLYDERGLPHQYEAELDSPATEETGENGLPGDVDRHLAMKLGGVFAISAIQGGTSALGNIGASSRGNVTNIFPSFGNGAVSAADIWLQKMIDIPDVLTRLEGQKCGVLMLHDLDMSGAYRLKLRYGRR